MHDQPLVSVITAVYNGERFLAETVAAVAAQDYPNWEYWIVNDGSRDRTAEILREASIANPAHIHVLEHEGGINRGLCRSRNLALASASGEYVAIVDADDVWQPTKLSEQVSIARKYPEAGLIYGRSEYWHSWSSDREQMKDHTPPLAPGDRLYHPPDLLNLSYPFGPHGAPCPSDLLIRKDLLVSLGGFEESFDRVQSHYEDIALLTKLYLAAPVYVSNRCWDRYRIHADSIWATGERTGAAARGRRVYFDWAKSYFTSQRITAEEIWRSWRNQTMRYRHPFLYFFIRAGRRLRRGLGSA